jgi:uncharacterized membrane protein YraQ (UPF0718 family)/copper chaperone CopZ
MEMVDVLLDFLRDLVDIINEMSPYLMLGFLFAGLLHVFFPKKQVNKYMGGNNNSSIINASLIGIPLPLCSCGVIPTGISFYNHGASKGSTVSFLISTPQTGIDSILVTYSLLGLPFALIRPVIALISGFFGGFFTNFLQKNGKAGTVSEFDPDQPLEDSQPSKNRLFEVFRFAFHELLHDISRYLVIGLLIAAIISVAIPDDFFSSFVGNDFLSMLVILVAAIPVYVCATASVPIAAVLMLKGLSPGAALVLLMAGPATNVATITLLNKVLGFRSLLAYLLTIIAGALIFGTVINHLLPASWFIIPEITSHEIGHVHGILPNWLKITSSIILFLLIINGYVTSLLLKRKIRKDDGSSQSIVEAGKSEVKKVRVNGMTCNHCKRKVEDRLLSMTGIKNAHADLSSGKVTISGKNLNLAIIKTSLESIGYDYLGETD